MKILLNVLIVAFSLQAISQTCEVVVEKTSNKINSVETPFHSVVLLCSHWIITLVIVWCCQCFAHGGLRLRQGRHDEDEIGGDQ